MTMCVAPARIAAAGCAGRACSVVVPVLDSACNITPGVTISMSAPSSARSNAASCGEATTPWQPARWASRARRVTCSSIVALSPMAARSVSVRLVTTVSAMTCSCGKSAAARTAASMILEPPMACTVTMVAPSRPAARTAPATDVGISNSLRSRKTSLPSRTSLVASVGPATVSNSRPTLYDWPASPRRSTIVSASSTVSKSSATKMRRAVFTR